MPRRIPLVALLVSTASCSSTPELEVRRLPVHVAIVPIAEPAIGRVTPGEFEGTETDLRLDLDGEAITRAVADVLEDYCFARVTLLELDSQAPGATVDVFERERRLVEEARARGADWILELGLRYDPEVYRENASTFWLNFPLFLFAGPANWFVPDIDYSADVELTARVYDLHALSAVGGVIGDPMAEVITVASRFGGAQLPFVARSGGVVDYLTGVLVPSGFLARESGDVSASLRADISAALEFQLVHGLQSRRDGLVRTAPIVPVYVEPEEVHIQRVGADLRVQGRALLRDDSFAMRVRAVHLDAGAGRVTAEPVAESEDGPSGHSAFRFDATVPVSADSRYLRLECEAGSRDRYVRSYTFRIPSGAGER
jgi:hypothetical protein